MMGTRIAVIEDETVTRESLVELLMAAGYRSEGFSNAHLFLGAFYDGRSFDLCVVDINLPGLRGDQMLLEVARTRNTREMTVLLLSGLDEEELRRAHTLLSNHFARVYSLSKPVEAESLLQEVETLLSSA